MDEHRGACRRCFVGAWQCEWPTPPGEKPLRTFVRGVKASGADSEKPSRKERFVPRRLSDAGSEHHSENEGGGPGGGDDEQMTGARYTAAPVQPYSNNDLDAVASGFSLPENASAGRNTGHALPLVPDHQPLPNGSLALPDFFTGRVPLETNPASEGPPFQPPPPPLATPNPFADLDILAPASSLSAFLRPNVDTNDLTDFFNSLDAEAGFWDTLGGSLSANGSAGAPSIAESGPSPDAGAYSSGLTPHPNDLSSSSYATAFAPPTTSSAPTLPSSSRAHLVSSNQALSSPSPSSHSYPAPSQSTSRTLATDSKTIMERQSSVVQTLPVAIDEEGPPIVDPVACEYEPSSPTR